MFRKSTSLLSPLLKSIFMNSHKNNRNCLQFINNNKNNENLKHFHNNNNKLYCDSNDSNIKAINITVEETEDLKDFFTSNGIVFCLKSIIILHFIYC